MGTAIEIIGLADFDIAYTESIMVSEETLNAKDLAKSFCRENNIKNLSELPLGTSYDVRDNFKQYLRKIGFKQLKTTQINIF